MDSPNQSNQKPQADPNFVRQISRIAETLRNLNYLITEDAGDPGKVVLYADASEKQLHALIQLILPRLRDSS